MYRSGLEQRFAQLLEGWGIDTTVYESAKLHYIQPASSHVYIPDFPMPNGVVLELKGRLRAEDRKKHALLKQEYPELDIRFVFQRSSTHIAPKSPTTYADWADKLGIRYCDISDTDTLKRWIKEPKNQKSLTALQQAMKH